MSYISKYLESLMTKKDAICDSQTTNSKYYTIGKAKIGLSDHFPEASKITCDVRIVNPLNAKTVYLVQVKEGPQILTFNLAGVKTFISNYLYIKEIKNLNNEVKKNNAKAKVKKTASKKVNRANCTCNKRNQNEWTVFWGEVSKNIPKYSKIMSVKKKNLADNKRKASRDEKEISIIMKKRYALLLTGLLTLSLAAGCGTKTDK